MLFSEPKIPQWSVASVLFGLMMSFSALQRAENSSMRHNNMLPALRGHLFQCSSASRKFLNCIVGDRGVRLLAFQCSSASRKFLNSDRRAPGHRPYRVSVLFSEPKIPQLEHDPRLVGRNAEFQCSSASRKFLNVQDDPDLPASYEVSVLFSEPKIPQSRPSHLRPSIFPTAMITLRHS